MLTQSASLPSAEPSLEAAHSSVLARAVQIVPKGLPEISGSPSVWKPPGGEVSCKAESKRCLLDAEFPQSMQDTNSNSSLPA